MPNVMAALPNIGGALCSSQRRKVWLTPTTPVPCSNAANIGERKIGTQSEFCTLQNSITGQEPRKCTVYVVYQPRRLPNIVQSLVGFR